MKTLFIESFIRGLQTATAYRLMLCSIDTTEMPIMALELLERRLDGDAYYSNPIDRATNECKYFILWACTRRASTHRLSASPRNINLIAFSVFAFTLFRRLRLLHDEFIEAWYLIIDDN